MFHTVFAKDIAEALNKYEGMKLDLQKFVDSDLDEKEFCHSFIDKWQIKRQADTSKAFVGRQVPFSL